MESYIVRIIRREKDPELILGTVEEVETQIRTGFNSFEMLRDTLSQQSNKETRKMVS